MNFPVHIEFRGMPPCAILQDRVYEHVQELEIFASDVASCHVAIDLQQKHPHEGRPFGAHIIFNFPRQELAVSRVQHEDAHAALCDAFDAMKRQLEDMVRRRRLRRVRYPWLVAAEPQQPDSVAAD